MCPRALRQLHVQQCQLVARFAGLLVEALELALCIRTLACSPTDDLKILQRQAANGGRACRKQCARHLRCLVHATSACHEAHLCQFFTLRPVHLHQHLQLFGEGTLRVLCAQGGQNALRFFGLVFTQGQFTQRGQTNGRITVGQQQFFDQLARQIGTVFGRPHLRSPQQLDLGAGGCGCFGLGKRLHRHTGHAGRHHHAPAVAGERGATHQRCHRTWSCPEAVNW